jgi:hypothetical protein
MNIVPFILQVLALIALAMASFGKGTIGSTRPVSLFPLGMFLWLLSLMATIGIHEISK